MLIGRSDDGISVFINLMGNLLHTWEFAGLIVLYIKALSCERFGNVSALLWVLL